MSGPHLEGRGRACSDQALTRMLGGGKHDVPAFQTLRAGAAHDINNLSATQDLFATGDRRAQDR